MKIAVIIGTTRDTRITDRLANWVMTYAQKNYPDVEFKLLDLKEYDIPFLNELPWHKDRVLGEGTKKWLKSLGEADGFVFVTAEYHHSIPGQLKNAIDFTDGELSRKPAAIVSHGVVGGARAAEHLRLVLNSLIGAMPVPHDVTFFGKVSEGVNDDGTLAESAAINDKKLHETLDELLWYTKALKTAREQ